MYLFYYSGGIDRTGLLIAMETALLKMEIVEPVDPLEIVRSMRDKRGMMLPAVVRKTYFLFICDNLNQAIRNGIYNGLLPATLGDRKLSGF